MEASKYLQLLVGTNAKKKKKKEKRDFKNTIIIKKKNTHPRRGYNVLVLGWTK